MNLFTRKPRLDEAGYLRHIWSTVFNDGDEASYFDYYFDPELCVVATHAGIPVSAGYLLPAGKIICGNISYPCAMIYGVATLPEYRSLGYAAAVVRDLLNLGREAGFSAITLCPSNDSLFEYYSACSELREWFYVYERKYISSPTSDLCGQNANEKQVFRVTVETRVGSNQAIPKKILPNAYGLLRETFLTGIFHIESDARALLYQKMLCQEFGGGLYRIDTSGGISCAIIEQQQHSTLLVKELLAPKGFEDDAISSIVTAFPSKEYIVRTPAPLCNSQFTIHNSQFGDMASPGLEKSTDFQYFHEDNKHSIIRRFGMISAPDSFLNAPNTNEFLPWFGLAFD